MNALPPSLTPDTTLGKWSALHDTGAVLSALADAKLEAGDFEMPALSASLAEAPEWRRELFERTALDVAAALQPGIAGVAALAARGTDPRAAAQALWAQFIASREALLALTSRGDGLPYGA